MSDFEDFVKLTTAIEDIEKIEVLVESYRNRLKEMEDYGADAFDNLLDKNYGLPDMRRQLDNLRFYLTKDEGEE